MIKKYLQFINESNDSLDMLLESNIVYSNKLNKVLTKINSPIAKRLLEIENKDYPVTSNYFDISPDKNNSINFISDRKAKEILGENKEIYKYTGDGGWLKHKSVNDNIFSKLEYKYTEDTEPYKPNSNDDGESVGKVVSELSGNTYIWVKWYSNGEYKGEGVYNQNKLTISDKMSDLLKSIWSKNRQDIAVGRCIRAIMRKTEDSFTDKEYEVFVNLFKSEIDKLNNKFSYFDIVSGMDIHYWYQCSNYYEKKGTIGNSCMSYAREQMLEIYTDNSNVELVILKSENNEEKIVGRALLWHLDDGKKFLDRIYTINDSDVQLFKEYAKQNGWYSKYYNGSSDNGLAISPTGEGETLKLVVTLNRKHYSEYPYLDTLKYFFNGKLYNNKISGSITLEDTDGGFIDDECEICGGSGRVSCYECGGDGNMECGKCDGDGRVDCDECDGNGNIECGECDGTGLDENDNECKECNGKGKIECYECDGKGRVECEECDGKGDIECYECGGCGEVDCPECS